MAFLGYGGGGFATYDKRFERMVKKMLAEVPKDHKVVLLLHQPPYGTPMDVVWGDEHVGNKSFTKFLEKEPRVVLTLCGHIHEGFRKKGQIGTSKVVNPGDSGMLLTL